MVLGSLPMITWDGTRNAQRKVGALVVTLHTASGIKGVSVYILTIGRYRTIQFWHKRLCHTRIARDISPSTVYSMTFSRDWSIVFYHICQNSDIRLLFSTGNYCLSTRKICLIIAIARNNLFASYIAPSILYLQSIFMFKKQCVNERSNGLWYFDLACKDTS